MEVPKVKLVYFTVEWYNITVMENNAVWDYVVISSLFAEENPWLSKIQWMGH